MLTGSEITGVSVAHHAAEGLKAASLELGGKSPVLVFEDAFENEKELDNVIEWVMFGCFWTNGQICSATSRLLIHESIYAKFLQKLIARTKQIVVGDPMVEGVRLNSSCSASA